MMRKSKKPNYEDMERALNADGASGSRAKDFPLFNEEEEGPQLYQPPNNLVTKPIIAKNLPKVFESLPIHGRPAPGMSLKRFQKNKLKSFIGEMSDKEFKDLAKECSVDHLKCGNEVNMKPSIANPLLMNMHSEPSNRSETPPALRICDTYRQKMEEDIEGRFFKKNLKYRNTHLSPLEFQALSLNDNKPKSVPGEPLTMTGFKKKNKKSSKAKKLSKASQASKNTARVNETAFHHGIIQNLGEPSNVAQNIPQATADDLLDPGIDILIKIRIYRPFDYDEYKNKSDSALYNLFYHDMILTGRNKMADIKENFVCSEIKAPSKATKSSNGFFFVKNAFYVDKNEKAADHADSLRMWCLSRDLGTFPIHDMKTSRLDQMEFKLGNPDVYIHDTTCEHIVIFSEIRLLNANDPLYFSDYPIVSAMSQLQKVPFCYNCCDFNPKWIVSDCPKMPFNMALFCQKCLKKVLYDGEGKKICKFKTYPYKEAERVKD